MFQIAFFGLLLSLITNTNLGFAAEGPAQRVGILEHKLDDVDPVVRPLFEKYPQGWRRTTLSSAIYGLNWKIIYSGKAKGIVYTSKELSNSSSLVLEISSEKSKTPIVEQPLDPFMMWSGKMQSRPLVAVKEDFYKDPQGWKKCEEILEVDIREKVRRNFKSVVPAYDICDTDGNVTRKDFNYKVDEIEVEQAFCNAKGANLFKAWITAKNSCDNPADTKFLPHWHYMAKDKVKHLGSQIRPIDAGDYDGDGKTEWIFILNQGQTDGYRLYLDDFTRMVEKSWKL